MSVKIAKKYTVPIVVGMVLLAIFFIATAKISYWLGERHISELILHSDVPDGTDNRTYQPPPNYYESIDNLRRELNRLSNDYDSACNSYQVLYQAYDALYAQAGPASGKEKIIPPGSARGSQSSCYR